MRLRDLDTSIYDEVVKGFRYSGFGLGELAHLAREVEAEMNAWYDMTEEREDLINDR